MTLEKVAAGLRIPDKALVLDLEQPDPVVIG
jgi:hypothetical protein